MLIKEATDLSFNWFYEEVALGRNATWCPGFWLQSMDTAAPVTCPTAIQPFLSINKGKSHNSHHVSVTIGICTGLTLGF